MTNEYDDVRREVLQFLASLKYSIDRPFSARSSDLERERLVQAMIMVEEARVRFSTRTRHRASISASEWVAARYELLEFVGKFLGSNRLGEVLTRRFRIAAPFPRTNNPSRFIATFIETKDFQIGEALIEFRSFLVQLEIKPDPVQARLTFDDLSRIVPRQQVAPIQFDIVKNRIVIAKKSPPILEADRTNISSALEHIKGSGDKLIQSLEKSNCDHRLLNSLRELHAQLTSDSNIVKVGLTNLACGIMCTQFQAELPDAIAAMFNSYNASVSLYVAQFPEWEQFTQKAAAIDLDDADIKDIDDAAGEIITVLNDKPELADPAVPKTIAFVRQFLSFPGPSAKRAAFAMIRTMENLVSSILLHTMGFFSKTAEKAIEDGSSIASKVIVGLLSVALMGAAGIGQAAVRTGAPWVQQAAEIVQQKIEKMTE